MFLQPTAAASWLSLPSTSHRLADEEIGPGKVPLNHTGLGRLAQHIDGNANGISRLQTD